MICNKCDICNETTECWKEVDFTYWKDNFTSVQIKQICPDCTKKIENFIKEISIKT